MKAQNKKLYSEHKHTQHVDQINHESRVQQIRQSEVAKKVNSKTKVIQQLQEVVNKSHQISAQYKKNENQRLIAQQDKKREKKLSEIKNKSHHNSTPKKNNTPIPIEDNKQIRNDDSIDSSLNNQVKFGRDNNFQNGNGTQSAGATGSTEAYNSNLQNSIASTQVGDQSQILNQSNQDSHVRTGTQSSMGTNYHSAAKQNRPPNQSKFGAQNFAGTSLDSSHASGAAAGQEYGINTPAKQGNNVVLGRQGLASQKQKGPYGSQSAIQIRGPNGKGGYSVGRNEEKIINDQKLVQSMIKFPPLVAPVNLKKLEVDLKKNKELGDKIIRFHHLKRKIEKEYDRIDKKDLVFDEVDDGLDYQDDALMKLPVKVEVNFNKIEFNNFQPQSNSNESYCLEIKACTAKPTEEPHETFKSISKRRIIKEIQLKEIRKSKVIYIAIYHKIDKEQTFLGDFEIDLSPYYMEGIKKHVKVDLRNYKELFSNPEYMPIDMRRRGFVEFDLKITSDIKKYIEEKRKASTDLGPDIVETKNQKDNKTAVPKKK